MLRLFGLFSCVVVLAGCELILVDDSDKDYTMDGGGACTMCGDVCVDLTRDIANCGRCENACAAGEPCVAGACVSMECASGLERCVVDVSGTTACVDTQSSQTHCGGCAMGCSDDCVDGECMGDRCMIPEIGCEGETTCIDAGTDPQNCGGCGIECATDDVCGAGRCMPGAGCDPGLTECGSDGCVDLETDPLHCGSCGTVCTGAEMCDATDGCICRFSDACGVCASPYHNQHCADTCGNDCDGNVCAPTGCSPTILPFFSPWPDPLAGGSLLSRGLASHVCPDELTDQLARQACDFVGLTNGRLIAGDTGAAGSAGSPIVASCPPMATRWSDCSFMVSTDCRYDPVVVICDAP